MRSLSKPDSNSCSIAQELWPTHITGLTRVSWGAGAEAHETVNDDVCSPDRVISG